MSEDVFYAQMEVPEPPPEGGTRSTGGMGDRVTIEVIKGDSDES